MIRVITTDSQDCFYDCDKIKELRNAYIDYENNIIHYDGDFAHAILGFWNIVKLEKQVKDLTTQEIYKFFNNLYTNDIDSIEICEDIIVVNWYDYGNKTYSEYFNEEYIDITNLIKENKNE